ncbi:MAG: hypothetical protein AB7E81_17740 [Hyphomicrobiaceae bacterium]
MAAKGDFRDPNWEPSEVEEAELLEDIRRTVLWREAMARRGIRVLAKGLTPFEEAIEVQRWWEEEGHKLDTAGVER